MKQTSPVQEVREVAAGVILKDLAQTAMVTLALVGIQMGLWWYLESGGWSQVMSFLKMA